MRVLVPVRVSRETDESTSPESQRAGALDYVDARPRTKIIFTDVADLGVSGATPIRERPGIAPWLRPDRINQWDAIGGYEMDRISRDMYDYLGFVREMASIGKIVIDLIDGTDTSTLRGRQTLEDRIMAAQRYREMVAEKRARAARRISDAGEWGGGRVPFGYKPKRREITVDGKERRAWYLVQDQEATAKVARRMVDDAFAGAGYLTIAKALNAEGVKSPIGREWRENAVRRILTSPALMGLVVKMEGVKGKNGQVKHKNIVTVRRDRNSQPIRFTDEPILSEGRWYELQTALKARSRHRGEPQARHLLWHVAYCRNCSEPCEDDLPCLVHDVPLYGHRHVKNAGKRNAYTCRRCGHRMAKLELFDRFVEWRVLREAGDKPLLVPTPIRGSDYSAEIIKLERRAERFRMELDAEDDTDIAEDLERAIRKTEAKIAELITGPHEPDRIELRPAEPWKTVAEHWASIDTAGRNKYLRDAGAIFYADQEGVIGQLGWMAFDSASFTYDGLRQMLRRIKMPTLATWQEISEALQMPIRKSRPGHVERAVSDYLMRHGRAGTAAEVAKALYGKPTESQLVTVRRAVRKLRGNPAEMERIARQQAT